MNKRSLRFHGFEQVGGAGCEGQRHGHVEEVEHYQNTNGGRCRQR